MSNSIDEKVVELKFQDGQFKSAVASVLSQLDALKKGLNLENAARGLDSIKSHAAGFDLSSMGEKLSQIASKFDWLKVVGVAALATLATQATMYGQKVLSGMTEGIVSGFQEYELKMGSIQTILANTAKYGTNLKDVTGALDELNHYADKTIYNFGDMTKNIGLFTNAGIRVEEATSMIKGFSNSAAASGTNAQGAASAAYQLSQALSTGTIRLMDWRSLTNVGMGNKNMQEGLIQLATAMGSFEGTTIDASDASADFNGSLEKNWLSADVMSKYLQIMAGDLDTAAIKSLGLSDAQVESFQKQAKTAEDAATKVRTATQFFGTVKEAIGSGWAQTMDLVIGDFDQATDLWTAVNDNLGTMIGAAGNARNKMLGEWNKLGGRDVALEAGVNLWKALLSVLNPIKEAFRDIFPAMTGKQLLTITEAIRDFTKGLILSKDASDGLKSTAKGLFAVLNIGWEIFKQLLGIVGRVIGVFAGGGSGILSFTGGIGDALVAVQDFLVGGGALEKFFGFLGDVILAPIKGLMALGQGIAFLFGKITGIDLGGIGDAFARLGQHFQDLAYLGPVFVSAWEKVVSFFQSIIKFLTPFAKQVKAVAGDIWEAIKEGLSSGDFSGVFDVLNLALTTGMFLVIRNFFKGLSGLFKKGGGGGGLIGTIKGIFGGLTETMEAMQTALKAKTLLSIAIAIGVLTASVVALSMIDSNRLTAALVAITVMFGQLSGAMAIFSKIAGLGGIAKIPVLAASLILLGGAVMVLAGAVMMLSGLDWGELARGLVGLAGVLVILVKTADSLGPAVPGMMKSGAAMIVLAVAVKILASAVNDLAGLDWNELARGLVGVGAVLASVAIFNKYAAANKGAAISGINILLLAGAMKLFASAVEDFGGMDLLAIGQGLLGVGVMLKLLSTFTNNAASFKGIIQTAVALTILGASMKILASATIDFASLSWGELARGLVAMGGALLLTIAALAAIPPSSLLGAAGLVVAAAGLKIMASALMDMGGMDWGEIGKAMVVLGGSLLILAVGLTAMIATLPGAAALVIAAAALAIFVPILILLGGLDWATIGTGLGALALSLGILALAGLALIPALPGLVGLGLAVGLIGIGVGVAAAGIGLLVIGLAGIATIGPAAGAGITSIATAILNLLPLAMQKLGEGIAAFADVIGNSGPQLVRAFTALILSMLQAINNVAPQIVTTLVNLLLTMLRKINDKLPEFLKLGGDIIVKFLNGLGNQMPRIATAGTNLIIKLMTAIQQNSNKLINAGIDTIIKFVNGLANGIRQRTGDMRNAGLNLATAIIDGMTGGLFSGASRVINAAAGMAGRALNAAKNALGIHSPSRKFYEVGEFSTQGQANGMLDNAGLVVGAAKKVGKDTLEAMREAMSASADILSNESEFNPTITPVVDLSKVRNGMNEMNSRLITNPTISTDISAAVARKAQNSNDTRKQAQDSAAEARQGNVKVLEYTQNITSPKAVNNTELYRNTKNLLSTTKEGLED